MFELIMKILAVILLWSMYCNPDMLARRILFIILSQNISWEKTFDFDVSNSNSPIIPWIPFTQAAFGLPLLFFLPVGYLIINFFSKISSPFPGTSTNFKCGLGLERGSPSLVRTIGYLLDWEVADLIRKVGIIRLDGLIRLGVVPPSASQLQKSSWPMWFPWKV